MSDLGGRTTALSPPQLRMLDLWATAVRRSLSTDVLLVGSALRVRDPRDVDVRIILDDEDPLLAYPERLPFLHTALSEWARAMTGLPVDAQFQARSEHDAEDGPLNPLGTRW